MYMYFQRPYCCVPLLYRYLLSHMNSLTYLQFSVTSGKASRTGHAHPAKECVTGNERSGQKTGPGPDDSTDYHPET